MITLCTILLAGSIPYVAWVEGPTNPFWVWNIVPATVTLLLLWKFRPTESPALPRLFGLAGLAVTVWLVVVYAHAAWQFDFDGARTGSSTAGLIFVVLPLLAMGAGGVGFTLGNMAGRLARRMKRDNGPASDSQTVIRSSSGR